MTNLTHSLSDHMSKMSGSLNDRMSTMSSSFNTRINQLSTRMDTIMIDLGKTKGKIKVILQRLDENDKAHGELGQRIEELAVEIQKRDIKERLTRGS